MIEVTAPDNLLVAIAAEALISAFKIVPSRMCALLISPAPLFVLVIDDSVPNDPNPKFVLAPDAVVAPVPPLTNPNTPVMFAVGNVDAEVNRVPLVGNVTDVVPDVVNVTLFEPYVSVPALLTPVPPRVEANCASELKFPEPSLMITWLAVPAASFERAIAAPVAMSTFAIDPSVISVEPTADSVANEPKP